MDFLPSTSETSENPFLFVFISTYVSFGVSINACSGESNFDKDQKRERFYF